ncbi:MAG: FtsX-like permease family protein [Arachnia sp.]
MLRHALSELRLHPGRFVATLIAIAISVGFVAAISVFVNSQQTAMSRQNALQLSKADVVVRVESANWGENEEDPLIGFDKVLAAEPGVTAVYPEPNNGPVPLTKGDKTVNVTIFEVPPAEFRWSTVVEGRLPDKPGELALSRGAMERLGVSLGESIRFPGVEVDWPVVGVTDDPNTLWSTVGYMAPTAGDDTFSAWNYILKVDGDPSAAVTSLQKALKSDKWDLSVMTGEEARNDALNSLTLDVDIAKYLLQGFGAIALLVGAITIANTFTILVTQRRRQLGLLRAVGASPGQVMGRIVLESFLVGAVGSLLGLGVGFAVAWVGGMVTGSNYFGLTVVPGELAIAWLVGVLVTMIASIGPAFLASRVKPLEALQAVPTAAQAKRAGIVRIVLCSLAAVIGIALMPLALGGGDLALLWAILGGFAVTAAVLGAAPLYVAPILALLGKVFGFAGPTTRMAFVNSARNPQRAASTATALMLAVGLIVTLQTTLATVRSSGMATLEKEFPIDVVATSQTAIPTPLFEQLRGLSAVERIVSVPTKKIEGVEGGIVLAPEKAYEELGVERPNHSVPAQGEVFLSSYSDVAMALTQNEEVRSGATLTFPGAEGAIELKVKISNSVDYNEAIVSDADFARLAGQAEPTQVWLKLFDRTSAEQLNQVTTVLEAHPEIAMDQSGAMMAGILTQVMNVMLIVLTALLGVAVLIALVGVGNTLGLSVIERQRESALLRALGMQRSGLRLMLLIEAVAMVAVGTVIGLAAGSFFGWLGVKSAISSMPEGAVELRFALDPWYTAGLIGICLLAAVLASILPGRKAANATPTEALAAD